MKIYDGSTFREIVEAERMRSAKAQSIFSMIAITTSDPIRSASLLYAVIRVLSVRIRCYDMLGWLDDDRLGVLLPDTPAEGALIMLGDIISSIADRQRLVCSITSYPCNGASSLDRASL